MEHSTGDRMNAAIESWRSELAAQTGLTADIRRELEAHLFDCIAAFQRRGLSEMESFQLARQRVGRPQQLGKEFKKAMNTTSPVGRALTFAAWALFVISFFLPSYTTMAGWQCALLQGIFWEGTTQGNFLSIHYQFLTLANAVMLLSPLLLAKFARTIHQVQWLHHATLGAAILVWAFVMELLFHQDTNGLKMGCFVWSISFTLLYLAVLVQWNAMRKETSQKHA